MSIPDYQSLMEPVLRIVERDGVLSMRDLADRVTTDLNLTAEDRRETIQSGMGLPENRTHWAVTYLFKVKAVSRPRRGHVEIAERGRELHAGEPVRNNTLERLPEHRAFIGKYRRRSPTRASTAPVVLDQDGSPNDLVARAEATARANLVEELLTRVRAVEPAEFERLVLNLLGAMGYGTAGSLEQSKGSGDAGIAGIISQDPLGLDRIYLQAKRYSIDNVVQRPMIQGFVGALMGAKGDRGVFLTTSSFSAGARAEAERVNARIELIDGDRLAELMVDHGVGVQPETVVTLHRVDEDFFEAL